MLTPVNSVIVSAVYSSLSLVQGSTGDLAALGAVLGAPYQGSNKWRLHMLVQFNSASTYNSGVLNAGDGTALKLIADPVASGSNYIVDATSAAGNMVFGVNDVSGQNVTKGYYFWITFKGYCQALCAASISAFTVIGTTATAGTLGTYASGGPFVYTLAASGSGGGKTDCWIM
jgi:hypothetical protein